MVKTFLAPIEKIKSISERSLKNNPEVYNQIKEKDKSCKAKKREQMSQSQIKRHKKGNAVTIRCATMNAEEEKIVNNTNKNI